MKRKMLFAVACAAALWSAGAFALPSSTDVQSAVKAGDFAKAETMMQEVVGAKPQSAKAHYLYAEILAHDAKFSDAAAQARQAREIDPALSFTNAPEKFRSFERLLQREQAGPAVGTPAAPTHADVAPARVPAPAGMGVPGWLWGVGIALVAFLIFRAVSRRAAANNMVSAGGYAPQGAGYGASPGMAQPGYGPGYAPGYGPAPGYGQAPGGGMLRTGLAAAGGVAAGMLAEKLIDGNHRDEGYGNNFGGQGGGYDNGSSQAATELEDRPIDFGSGGNDWGGDSSGSDNFSPSGGSDDGGGW